MKLFRSIFPLALGLIPAAAAAQSGFISGDGKSRYPGVTIFCPSGTGVAPCNFSGGGGGGAVSINLGGSAVGLGNRFPVTDTSLDALITGGALSVSGSVSLSGSPSVAISGTPTVNLAAGTNAIGAVSVSNFPASQSVAVSLGGSAVGAANPLPITDAKLDAAISAGAVTIGGSVSLTGTPAVTLTGGSVGSVTAGGTAGSLAQSVQGIAGGVALPVSGSFWQATQPISASALPLPAGAATATPNAPVAPGAATATNSTLIGCLSNTTLPAFAAGQQGAVPCDNLGRPYVVTVPSANNVPSYLQAVSTGGATTSTAVNLAASCMPTVVKAGTGMMFTYSVSNSNSTPIWLRLFASATAPTCGVGTPVRRIYVPASSTVGLSFAIGWVFSGGISFDVTSGSGADTDATNVAAANSVFVNVDYK